MTKKTNNNKVNQPKKSRTKTPVMVSKKNAKKASEDYWIKEQLDIHENVSKIIKKISDPGSNIKVPNITYGDVGFINQSDSITTVTIDSAVLGPQQKMRAMLVPNFRFPLYITNASLNYTGESLSGTRKFAQHGVSMSKLSPPGVINPGATLPRITGSPSPYLSLEIPLRTLNSQRIITPYYDEILQNWLYPINLTYIPGQTLPLDIISTVVFSNILPTTYLDVKIYDSSYNQIGNLNSAYSLSSGTAQVSFSVINMDLFSSTDFAFMGISWTRGFTSEVVSITYNVSFPSVSNGNYTIMNGIENESYDELANLGILGNFLSGSVLAKFDGAMQTANGNCAIVQVNRGYEKSKLVGQTRSSFDGTAFSYTGITKVPGSFKSSCIEGMYGFYKPENAILDLTFRPLTIDVFDAPMVYLAADFTGTGGAFSLTVNSTVKYTTQSQLVSKNYALCDQLVWTIVLSLLSSARNVSENPGHMELIHKIGSVLDKHKDTIKSVGKGALALIPPLMMALAAL